MAEENRCPHCGAHLPTDALRGVCPRCLMKAGLEGEADATLERPPAIEGPGTKICRYRLLELVGEGGMGLVYLAEQQEPVRRKVAMKIVKLGMDTKQVVARFEAERQTLAMLEHPNIAHVFDAGATDGGRPYFVMEYVKGKSITKYCDDYKLSVEERLKLFRQVCDGVHHAHQKGIIHRDIKPSNILVSVQDDKAVPKIIDFGIAKAITQPLTEKTSYTEQGQLLGTPEYMSPEQAEMAYQDIDTRSDIYSLGVVLYELLAGVTPFDAKMLREGGIDHIQQVICEEEPRTPSARLTSLGDKAKAVADSRRTQIITLTRRLHRELEWIPMKAMRKDRTRRYRSASELADDIQNYLTGTPLIAGPESTLYRARKFVRKHAGSVATAVLLAVVIILGLVASIVMGCRAEQARKQETIARAQAEEQAKEYRRLLYLHSIALADVAYREGDISRLRKLLDECPEDLRAWEWYRLNHLSSYSCMVISGHTGPIYTAAFSPDSTRIVSSWDSTIKVWEASTGTLVMDLKGHDARVVSVAFSPDGKRIVSGSNNGLIKVWDTTSGAELMTLSGGKDSVSVAFSPNGKRIVSGSDNGLIKVWDATSGVELMTLTGHKGAVRVFLSRDGEHIVSGGTDNTIRIWEASSGVELMTLSGHGGRVVSGAISPDGKLICSSSTDGTIKIWEAATGVEMMTLRPHKEPVFAVSFSPNSKRIITGSVDHSIKVLDLTNGQEIATLLGHEGIVLSVSFSMDGQRIVSSSLDGTVRVWDTAFKSEDMTLPSSHHVAFSPDNKRIISAGMNDNTVKVFDIVTGTELMTLCGHSGRVWSMMYSPDGIHIVSGSFDRTVRIWDAVSGEELKVLRGHEDRVWSVAFDPSGRRIISGSYDGSVRVWDVETGNELMTLLGHDDCVETVACSPDGKRIISGSGDNTIKVWDAETGEEVMTLLGHNAIVEEVLYSSDGQLIISGSWDNTVKVWNALTGVEMMTLRHKSRVWSVDISSDGRRIISGSGDGSEDYTLTVWDVATGTEVMTLKPGKIRSIKFSPDDRTIAVDSYDSVEDIRFLESKVPPNGYELRRTGTTAKTLVDELYKKLKLYSKVIEELESDQPLGESVCKLALQIANARLWEDEEKTE